MNTTIFGIAAAACLAALSLPAAAQTNPRIMLQHSSITGTENQIQAYGVPTTNSDGKVKYYDLVIEFTPDPSGAAPTAAVVTSAKSPKVSTKGIVAGDYVDSYDGSCTVTNVALQSGRTQSNFQCIESHYGYPLYISVVTGAIDSGHPYEAQLKSAGIDQRGDVGNYYWGIVTLSESTGSGLSGCNSFATYEPIGAQQAGETITLSLFTTTGAFTCAVPLNMTEE